MSWTARSWTDRRFAAAGLAFVADRQVTADQPVRRGGCDQVVRLPAAIAAEAPPGLAHPGTHARARACLSSRSHGTLKGKSGAWRKTGPALTGGGGR